MIEASDDDGVVGFIIIFSHASNQSCRFTFNAVEHTHAPIALTAIRTREPINNHILQLFYHNGRRARDIIFMKREAKTATTTRDKREREEKIEI